MGKLQREAWLIVISAGLDEFLLIALDGKIKNSDRGKRTYEG